VADADVAAPIGRERPPPHDVGAVTHDHLFGGDHVAERLVHRAAARVEHPAVREHVRERRTIIDADADHERRVEPAAVLVWTLEVEDATRRRPGRRMYA